MTIFYRYILFLFLGCSGYHSSYAASSEWQTFSHSQAQLISSHDSVTTDTLVSLGLRIQLRANWHTYWSNPGDTGSPPKLNWSLGTNHSLTPKSSVLWPTPRRILNSGLVSYAHTGEVLLMQKFKTQSGDSHLTIQLNAEWLVCDDICVPQHGIFHLDIQRGIAKVDNSSELLFKTAELQHPQHSNSHSFRFTQKTPNTLTLSLPADWKLIDFFVDSDLAIDLNQPQVERWGNIETLIFKTSNPNTSQINGVLQVMTPEGEKNLWLTEKLTPAWKDLLKYILSAFIGGLLLNLMPCVLPVLALKTYSILKMQNEERRVQQWDSFFYTIGILISFWILSLALFLLQRTSWQLGWGFQLQSPYFVSALIVLFITMTLSLSGIFSLQILVPASLQKTMQQQGRWGSFASGLLAVIVASPCTAPFMGTAIGFALSQNFVIIFSIFTSLGLGLAFPYIILSLNPKVVALILPRPGKWMIAFKKWLALPLGLTAFWLSWILWQQLRPAPINSNEHQLQWTSFDKKNVENWIGKKEIFIDFTADWCLTCKVNEQLVFKDQQVMQKLKDKNILLIKADWTNYNPEITDWLKKFNRVGVPFYLLYRADGSVDVLPELLTPSAVIQALERTRD